MKILAEQNIVVTKITPMAFGIDPWCAIGYNSVVQSVQSKPSSSQWAKDSGQGQRETSEKHKRQRKLHGHVQSHVR